MVAEKGLDLLLAMIFDLCYLDTLLYITLKGIAPDPCCKLRIVAERMQPTTRSPCRILFLCVSSGFTLACSFLIAIDFSPQEKDHFSARRWSCAASSPNIFPWRLYLSLGSQIYEVTLCFFSAPLPYILSPERGAIAYIHGFARAHASESARKDFHPTRQRG